MDTLRLADDLVLTRMGYGAMQLSGPGVYGPPRDHDAAIAVLRAVVDAGITHIDTSDFYGPHITNQLIREALHPYPSDLRIVTKVGAKRLPDKSWPHALSRTDLVAAVDDNLRNLGVDALDVVNLRIGNVDAPDPDQSPSEPFGVLAELRKQGKIRHLGVSNVTTEQLAEAQALAPVVCVQNYYNLAHRTDERLVDVCARDGIAFVPFFPLGGFSPLQSGTLDTVAKGLDATPLQVALAWLLHRSPTVLLIPGTSSVEHLRENIAAASLELPADALAELDALA